MYLQHQHFSPRQKRYVALLFLLFGIMGFGAGCSTSKSQFPSPATQLQPQQIFPVQSENPYACIERREQTLKARDDLKGWEMLLFFQTDAASFLENYLITQPTPISRLATCRPEEMVGVLQFILPEPDLIEDPLLEDSCIESAYSWCNPDVEDMFLAYLEEEKQHANIEEEKPHALQASIFPNFVSPVDGGIVLRGMQPPGKKRRGHYGLDIIPETAMRSGTPIKAVEDGMVIISGKAKGYGYYTVIHHQNGLFSLYSHTVKNDIITVGQTVSRGEMIALMGKSGNARGYHLHFELIDLRELGGFDAQVDAFIDHLLYNFSASNDDVKQFCKLLFNKDAKKDPLQNIPGLAMAKKVNGKWMAMPGAQTSVSSKQ